MICWNFCSGVLLSPWPRTPGLHLNFMTSSESTDSKKNEDEEKTGKMRLNKVPAKEIFFFHIVKYAAYFFYFYLYFFVCWILVVRSL